MFIGKTNKPFTMNPEEQKLHQVETECYLPKKGAKQINSMC